LARVSDGVTSGAKIARAGYVANGFGAARTGEAVDRGNSSNLTRCEIRSRRGSSQAKSGNDDGEGIHIDKKMILSEGKVEMECCGCELKMRSMKSGKKMPLYTSAHPPSNANFILKV
jgi:hypothetical protein